VTTWLARFRRDTSQVSPAWKTLLAFGAMAVTALITLTLGGLLLCNWYHFRSGAMEPSVHRGQWIWTRPAGEVHRGQMVLLMPNPVENVPRDEQPRPLLVLTRIVAVSGEVVSASGGRVQIDGKAAHEPYLPAHTTTQDIAPTKVPAGAVYVLGDHRSTAAGSFFYGPVPLRLVKERLVWVGAPSVDLLIAVTTITTLAYLVLANEVLRRRPTSYDSGRSGTGPVESAG
jgi:signal peptidase I